MQLNITGHHVELTDVQVTLSVEKQRQIAEATIHISGADIHGTAEQDDMYAAIDLLVDKLDRQILKHKEKQVERSHGTSAR